MVKSPGIQAKEKVACFEAIAKKGGFQDVSTNLLSTLINYLFFIQCNFKSFVLSNLTYASQKYLYFLRALLN